MLRLASLLLKVVAFAVLLGILALAWLRGPEIWSRFSGDGTAVTSPQPDSAQAAAVVRRYDQLANGDVDELVLTAPELESVLRYELADHLPPSASALSIRFEEGEANVRMEIPLPLPGSFPRRLGGILPDGIATELTGVIVSTGDGGALFMVSRVEVAQIPLPRRAAAAVLRSLASGTRDATPPEAFRLELPPGVRAAYIEGDRLILAGRT